MSRRLFTLGNARVFVCDEDIVGWKIGRQRNVVRVSGAYTLTTLDAHGKEVNHRTARENVVRLNPCGNAGGMRSAPSRNKRHR